MKSLRNSINAMCKQCIYDPYQKGAWRQQVQACTDKTCPLYEVRPKDKVRKNPKGADHVL